MIAVNMTKTMKTVIKFFKAVQKQTVSK